MKEKLRSFSVYALVSLYGSAAGFILMPFLTHYLSTDDYGTLALFNTYVQLLIPFISISAFGLVNIEHFNKELDWGEFRSIFSSISLIPATGFIFFFILVITERKFFSEVLELPTGLIWAIPVFALLSIYFQQFQSYVVMLQKSKLYALVNISKTTLEYGLVIVFIICLGVGWFGRVGAAMIIYFLAVLVSISLYSKWGLLTKAIKWNHIRAGLLYGYPLIFHVVGKFVINQSDKIFISQMVSKSELGIYNTGYIIGSIVMILSGAFINVYNPFVFERLSKSSYQKKIEIVRLAYLFLITLLFTILLLTLLSPILFSWFINEAYSDGVKYVFWIALSYFFWGIYLVFSSFLFYFKKTKVLAYLSILNVILNLCLNYLLIARYYAIGAAYATCISFCIVSVVVCFFSFKQFPMPWFSFKAIISKNET